jgi:hypothetical protein
MRIASKFFMNLRIFICACFVAGHEGFPFRLVRANYDLVDNKIFIVRKLVEISTALFMRVLSHEIHLLFFVVRRF